MKKWWAIILIVFFSLSLVDAYSKEKGLEWLNSAMNWPSDNIEGVSFALLALGSNNYEVDTPRSVLSQRVTTAGGSFDSIKDSALAALALDFFNDDVTSLLSGIEKGLTKANIGDWFIQITTNGAGVCNITYKANSIEVTVNGNEKLEINGKEEDWISIETYLGAIVEPIETIKVDCGNIQDANMIISLLRIPLGNEFFIIDEKTGNNVVLEINNACYSTIKGGTCDTEVTFYTSWVLNKLDKELKTQPYLEDNANSNLYYAMLGGIISGQNKYTDLLVQNQNEDGGWDNDIIITSFAINTLREQYTYRNNFNNATSWLQDQQIVTNQENNGSFGGKIETAVALYLALTEPTIPQDGVTGYCGDGFIDAGEECDDLNLDGGDGCSSICLIESGWQCTGEPSSCTQSITTCTSNLDCAFGYICDPITSTCVSEELPTRCSSRFDCPVPNDYECVGSVCRPLATPTTCAFDWQCPNNYVCVSGLCQFSEVGGECEFDYQCREGEFCDITTGTCKQKTDEKCGDGFCDFDEDSTSCPQDCPPPSQEYCGDDICQLNEKEGGTCPEDCGEERGFPFWIIWLLIIVVILVGGGWFFYTKFLKKPRTSPKPSYLGPGKPEPEKSKHGERIATRIPPRHSARESQIERELDKSISEAQKLLRRKK